MKKKSQVFLFICFVFPVALNAQMITGVWKGRINRQKAELKLIQNGDSLAGSVYYFESSTHYRRYSIKGYFDQQTNEAVWWDDQLIEEKTSRFSLTSPGRNSLISRADFNCPGDGRMMLDGKTARKNDEDKFIGDVDLDKTIHPLFEDEWDFVIENYTLGANDPYIIDSIALLSQPSPVIVADPVEPREEKTSITPVVQKPVEKTEEPQVINLPVINKQQPPPTMEEKFNSRKNILVTEIPLSGDSIELRFYDNAEIDGDSISLFLNGRLVFQHIRLTGKAYTIKLSVAELKESNDLIMVAENLGTIPPNTSYMIAIVDGRRYEARLESTEGSSAMVRFVKKASSY